MSKIPPASLPEPTPDEQVINENLTALIRAQIEQTGGAIPFSRFMDLALYAPQLGYYSAGQHKFGITGDFVTAPELGPVFAQCLARQCAQIQALLQSANILEAGAGSGTLAADLLLELERLGQLPRQYLILEISNSLRARQEQTLADKAPHLLGRVRWIDRLPAAGWRGIVMGNELLDAMPVERFRIHNETVQSLMVGWENNHFVWREQPASSAVLERIAPLQLQQNYVSEIGFAAEGWVRSVADLLQQGVILLIDYGFPRHEFFHPERRDGTLMCHYRHHAHSDPLIRVGLQDITAHVDFSAIAKAGIESGLELLGYNSQAMFLLGCGLDEIAAGVDQSDPRSYLQFTHAVKKLTLPHEMGELFKVIALGRGIETSLIGFRLQNRRATLNLDNNHSILR